MEINVEGIYDATGYSIGVENQYGSFLPTVFDRFEDDPIQPEERTITPFQSEFSAEMDSAEGRMQIPI